MFDIKVLRELTKDYTVLYVEDDENISDIMCTYLKKFFSSVDFAANGEEGLELYTQKEYDLVLTDIQMPKMDGLEMSRKIKEINSDQNIIIISAYSDVDKFTESIKIAVDGYILKPIDYENLNATIYKVILKIKKFKEHAIYEKNLEQMVETKTNENLALQLDKVNNYEQTLYALIDLVENRDTYTGKHSIRVANYSKLIAQKMNFSDEECSEIHKAGILHDLGKIAIPDSLLLKPTKFNQKEFELIKEHVNIGFQMLNQISMFKETAKIINCHHERLDGSGYPNALKGDEIPIKANIMALADAFDAMTTNRIYKPRKTISEALKEIKKFSGIHFKKEIVDVALKVLVDVEIDTSITQLPASTLEQERFSYFYNDNMTGLFNEAYLDYILVKNKSDQDYKEINIFSINNFREYNEKVGWSKGNEFLVEFSKILTELIDETLIFRIHGDYFIIVCENEKNIEQRIIEELNKFLSQCGFSMSIELKTFNILENNISSASLLESFI